MTKIPNHIKLLRNLLLLPALLFYSNIKTFAQKLPNIVIIYADDLGYGDVSAYGATKVQTPNIDRIAKEGLSFTNGHAASATCTPSRYALLTGKYPWRQSNTHIAPGDAALIVPTDKLTLPRLLQQKGYQTAVVGKWHLGLGGENGPDWNGEVKPGPLEVGFNYSFILPATGDRAPCIYVENHRVVNSDATDPIAVSYKEKIGNEPTGAEHPELLKMPYSSNRGHDQTIVNGISRIGYMSGGKKALWKDEDMADVLAGKAVDFITQHQHQPFFLYFATHDIHVPHVPNQRFVHTSNTGLRGDAIQQLDWQTGRIIKVLDSLHLQQNTIVIFSSDNGPAIQDGYEDGGFDNLNGHTPSGPYRGGKYSAFDAGTRVPFIIRWPGKVKGNSRSDAMISQVDIYASLSRLLQHPLAASEAPDSYDLLTVLQGKSNEGRKLLIENTGNGCFGLLMADGWKYIRPYAGAKVNKNKIELGNDAAPQLYDLNTDIGEKQNLATQQPQRVADMEKTLQAIIAAGRSRN